MTVKMSRTTRDMRQPQAAAVEAQLPLARHKARQRAAGAFTARNRLSNKKKYLGALFGYTATSAPLGAPTCRRRVPDTPQARQKNYTGGPLGAKKNKCGCANMTVKMSRTTRDMGQPQGPQLPSASCQAHACHQAGPLERNSR